MGRTTTREHSKLSCPRRSICKMITIFLVVVGIMSVIIYTITQKSQKKPESHRAVSPKQNSKREKTERNDTDETQRSYSSTSSDNTNHDNLEDELENGEENDSEDEDELEDDKDEEKAPETPQIKKEKLSWVAWCKSWLPGSAKNTETPKSAKPSKPNTAEKWKPNDEQRDDSNEMTRGNSQDDVEDEENAPKSSQMKREEIPKSTASADGNRNGCTDKAPKNYKRNEKLNNGKPFSLYYFLKESGKCPSDHLKDLVISKEYDSDENILEALKDNNGDFKL